MSTGAARRGRVTRRHVAEGAAVGVIAALNCLLAARFAPVVYESATTLEASGGTAAPAPDAAEKLRQQIQEVASGPETTVSILQKDGSKGDALAAAESRLRNAVQVEALPARRFGIKFRADSAASAQNGATVIANSVTASFANSKVVTSDQARTARASLDAATKDLAAFVAAHPTDLTVPASRPARTAANDAAIGALRAERQAILDKLAKSGDNGSPVSHDNPYESEQPDNAQLQRRLIEIKNSITSFQTANEREAKAATPGTETTGAAVEWQRKARAVADAQHAVATAEAADAAAPALRLTVVASASLPTAPVESKRALASMLGILAGALIGGAWTFGRARFARRRRWSVPPSVRQGTSDAPASVGNVTATHGTEQVRFLALPEHQEPRPFASPTRPSAGEPAIPAPPRMPTFAQRANQTQIGIVDPANFRSTPPPEAMKATQVIVEPRSPTTAGNPMPPMRTVSLTAEPAQMAAPQEHPPIRQTQKSVSPDAPRPAQKSVPPVDPPRPAQKSYPPGDAPRAAQGSAPPDAVRRYSAATRPMPGSPPGAGETNQIRSPVPPPPPRGKLNSEIPRRPSVAPAAPLGSGASFQPRPPGHSSEASRDENPHTRRIGTGSLPPREEPRTTYRPDTTYSFVDPASRVPRRRSEQPETDVAVQVPHQHDLPQSDAPAPEPRTQHHTVVQAHSIIDASGVKPGQVPMMNMTQPGLSPLPQTFEARPVQNAIQTRSQDIVPYRSEISAEASAPLVEIRQVPHGWAPRQVGPAVSPPELFSLRDQLLELGRRDCIVLGVVNDDADVDVKAAIAARLAAIVAQDGRARVLLMESDFDYPTLHEMVNVEMPLGAGFSQQVRSRGRSGQRKPWIVVRCSPTFDVLVEGTMRTPGVLASQEFAFAVAELRRCYDVIIANASSNSAGADRAAVDSFIDGVVVVCPPAGDLQAALERGNQWFEQKALLAAVHGLPVR